MVRSYRANRQRNRKSAAESGAALRVALYARISTGEGMQAEGHSIEAQVRLGREFAARKGWTIVHEYIDEDQSGATDQRPAFKKMIEAAYAGEFQVILFHKLDRFSRSIADTLYYFKEMESHHVLLCSVAEDFDFSDPADRAKFHMLAVFAQWYIDNLSAETTKGKKERALKGLTNGRLPFGYVKGPDGKPQLVPAEAEAVRQAFEAYATGQYTDAQIAELFNAAGFETRRKRGWSKDSARDFLQNEFYAGMVKYRDQLINTRQHPPIISLELFQQAQQVRASHAKAPRSHAPIFKTYILGGRLRCIHCGETLRSYSTTTYRYYKDLTNTRGLHCPVSGKAVKAEVVEAQIGALLCQLQLPADWQDEIRAALLADDERTRLLARQQFLEGKLERLWKGFVDGAVKEADYNREREAIQAELNALIIPENVAIIDAGLYLETLRDIWPAATLEEQKEICQLLLERVEYDLEQQQIVALIPQPEFLLLFRQLAGLRETEFRRFEPVVATRARD